MGYPADFLFDRLTNPERKVMFVVGSGLAMPTSNTRGVPGAPGITDLIRLKLGLPPEAYCCDASPYQSAFEELRGRLGPGAVNRMVREAVLEARTTPLSPGEKERHVHNRSGECIALGRDTGGWALAPGMLALGQLIAHHPDRFDRVVLTSNFDPLIEVSLRRAGCEAIPIYCDIDTPLEPFAAQGSNALVVHFHGSWDARDTLHGPAELAAARPQLENSVRSLISNAVVVVIGYSGWNDLFTNVLRQSLKDQTTGTEVIWCSYSDSVEKVRHNQDLAAIIGNRCVDVYVGVDANAVLPVVAERLKRTAPRKEPAAPALIFDVTRPGRPSPCYLENRWGLDRGAKIGVLFLPPGKSSGDVRAMLGAVENQVQFEAARAHIDLPPREWALCRPADLGTIRRRAAHLIGIVCELESGDLPSIALHLASARTALREGFLSLLLTSQFPAGTHALEHITRVRQAVSAVANDARYLSYPLPVSVRKGAPSLDAWPGAGGHELTDDDLQISRFTQNPATFDVSQSSRQLAAAKAFVVGETVASEFVRQASLTHYEMALRLGLPDSICVGLLELAKSHPDIWWLATRVRVASDFLGVACRLGIKQRAILGLVSAAEWRSLSEFERQAIDERRGGDPLNLCGSGPLSGRISSVAGGY